MKPMSPSIHRRFEQIAELSIYQYHLMSSIMKVLQNSRVILHVGGKLRRFWMVHFRHEYVQRQLSVRQGDCRQCGACCNLLFTCPMLTLQGRCLAYGICRPRSCKVFPIDQQDIDEVKLSGELCGYHFNERLADQSRIGILVQEVKPRGKV